MRARFVLALLANLLWVGGAVAWEKKTDKADGPEQAIHATIDSYIKAFNAGNASDVAQHWSEDGEYVLPSGEKLSGQEAIREHLTKLFASEHAPKIEQIQAEVKLLGKDSALEEGVVRLKLPDGQVEESKYLAVHVKQGKHWKVFTVREAGNAASEPTVEETAHQHLTQLNWLIGEWTEKSSHGEVLSSFQWAKNNSFITGVFRVPLPDGKVLEGTQIIGWDPEAKVIRSWVFDSHGGFGHGVWTRGNKHWSVKFEQVLADGRRATSTNVYDILDNNSYAWKSIGRKLGGEYAPNVGPITAIRAAAE